MYVVDGGWSSWTCGSCSGSCGGGTKQCSRKCDSPLPSCGGNGCSGPGVKVQSCPNDNPGMYVRIDICTHVESCTIQ